MQLWQPFQSRTSLWSLRASASAQKKRVKYPDSHVWSLGSFQLSGCKDCWVKFFEERWILVTFVQLCQYTVAGVLCQVSQRSCIETTRYCWESMERAGMRIECWLWWGVCLTHAVALWWQVVVWTLVNRRPRSRQERLTGQWRCQSESWLCRCREAPPPGKQYTDRTPLDTVKSAVERGSKRDSVS